MAEDWEKYKILLDGEWSLAEFYELPHAYSQVYAFIYALESPDGFEDHGAVLRYSNYPWRRGFSSLNFYRQLQEAVPIEDRPKVVSIQYASPGWIELSLAVGAALSIRTIIKAFVASASELNALYHQIYKNFHERKLMNVEAERAVRELKEEELRFLESSSKRLARLLKIPASDVLLAQAGNPVARVKMLLSLFRRVETLAEYERKGKAEF
jgi:hypothetical protein